MPDVLVHDLTRDQIRHLNAVIEIFGEPSLVEEVPPIMTVLEAAKSWFMHRQQELRVERG